MKVEYLRYVLDNCMRAFTELRTINRELSEAMSAESTKDVNRLGNLNRMIQDYLVVRVAGLFDRDDRTISFHTIFPGDEEVKEIENEGIIKAIKNNRNRFVAHSDHKFLKEEGFGIPTDEICSSNLGSLLGKMNKLLSEKSESSSGL